ncbi:MAG: sorbosone dehydrogenase family protein, partial [Acetobacteraceae bacterium]|nr:sorbosone dehydrogenase family protein [Acetobacteraceae bacterium]
MFRFSTATIGLAAALALFPAPAPAQQVPQPPANPPWAQGRPEGMAASPLAPHAPKLTATAPDRIPVSALRVPEGFKVELWAHGAPGVRMLAEGPDGTVFGGARAIGRVYAVSEEGGQRRVRTVAQGLDNPNGVAVRDGNLYVLAINRVLRYDGIEAKLDNPGAPVELTERFGLPTEAHHGWKFAAFSPDGRLTMNVGVPCNICEFDRDRFALIVSFLPDGSDRRIEAKGIRNSVGFDWHP